MATWGFGEAILLPIVPDVLLWAVAAAAPRRAAPLFAWTLLGALLGSLVLSAVAMWQPATARDLVLAVPGIDRPMLDEAIIAVREGDPLSMAHFGPGTPLKVYTVAWWEGSGTPAGYLVGLVANRLERIGPGVALMALIGALVPMWIRRRERPLLVGYVLFWVGFYAQRFVG
jgi:hypothetical protein